MKITTENKLSSSLEDYLEAISNLEKANRVARVKDIANNLKVKMPSVTGALKVLRKKGLINYEKNSFIILTDKGLDVAGMITTKHKTLTHFLETILCIPYEKAQDMACKMEHAVDCDTVTRMKRLIESFEKDIITSGKIDRKGWKKLIEGKAS